MKKLLYILSIISGVTLFIFIIYEAYRYNILNFNRTWDGYLDNISIGIALIAPTLLILIGYDGIRKSNK